MGSLRHACYANAHIRATETDEDAEMRSLRAIVFAALLVQVVIVVLLVSLWLAMTRQSNLLIRETQRHTELAQRANRAAATLATARRLEKDFFLAINSTNRNVSSEQAYAAWHAAYLSLGQRLDELEAVLDQQQYRTQLTAWEQVYDMYGRGFDLIARSYPAESRSPQEANEAMNAFDGPLQRFLDQLNAFAAEQNRLTERSWERLAQQRRTLNITLLATGSGGVLLSLALAFWLSRRLTTPVLALTNAAERVAQGDFEVRVPGHRRHELGLLGLAFNRMAEQLRTQHRTLTRRADELEAANRQQQELLAQLQASLDEREALTATIRELSVPVIPVLPGVLIVPLVGAFDTARAADLHQIVLQRVEKTRARQVLLDVTGVPVLDTAVAQMLIQLTDALRLLGAQPTLVGVRPEVAQTLVHLGVQFHGLVIKADLENAIITLLSHQRLRQAV